MKAFKRFCDSAQAPSEYGLSDDRHRAEVTNPLRLLCFARIEAEAQCVRAGAVANAASS
jgi:hypothetical protein